MKSNTLILVGIWALILVFGGTFLFGVGKQVWSGDILAILPVAFAVGMYFVVRLLVGDRKILRLLQSETADPLLAHFKRAMMGRAIIPNGDAFYAHGTAIANILYGNYPAAHDCLNSVIWSGRMPLIQGCAQSAEALLCYFDTHEYEKGLELARSAMELAKVDVTLPGTKTSSAAYGSYVEIGEILCDRATPQTLESLRIKSSKVPALGKILIAWGLAVGYRKAGNVSQAEVMRNYLRKKAPHCRALAIEIA